MRNLTKKPTLPSLIFYTYVTVSFRNSSNYKAGGNKEINFYSSLEVFHILIYLNPFIPYRYKTNLLKDTFYSLDHIYSDLVFDFLSF